MDSISNSPTDTNNHESEVKSSSDTNPKDTGDTNGNKDNDNKTSRSSVTKSLSLPPARFNRNTNESLVESSDLDREKYTLTFTQNRLGMTLKALTSGYFIVAGFNEFDLNCNESRRKPKIGTMIVGMEDYNFKGQDPQIVGTKLRESGRPLKLHFIEFNESNTDNTETSNSSILPSGAPSSSDTITVTGRIGMWARLMGTFEKAEGRQAGGKPVYWKGNAARRHYLYYVDKSNRWGITDREENIDSGKAAIGSAISAPRPNEDNLKYMYYKEGSFINDIDIRASEGGLDSPKMVTLRGGGTSLSFFMGCYEKVEGKLINGRPVYKKNMEDGACWLSNCPSTGTWVIHDNDSNLISKKYQRPRIRSNASALLPHDTGLSYHSVRAEETNDLMTVVEGDWTTMANEETN